MDVGHRFVMASVFGLVSAGCGGHALDVGSTDGGGVTDVEVTPDVNPFADANPAAPEEWVGHFVNHQLPDGSDTLTLTVQFAQDGTVTGTLLLGDGVVLAPPTDPGVGYPPYAAFSSVNAIEGFPYAIREGKWSGSSVTLRIVENEAWSAWCALQTSYLQQPATDAGTGVSFYSCNPPGGYEVGPTGCSSHDEATKQTTPLDCGKLRLCMSGVCLCTATGCSLNQVGSADMGLSLVLAGAVATERHVRRLRELRRELRANRIVDGCRHVPLASLEPVGHPRGCKLWR